MPFLCDSLCLTFLQNWAATIPGRRLQAVLYPMCPSLLFLLACAFCWAAACDLTAGTAFDPVSPVPSYAFSGGGGGRRHFWAVLAILGCSSLRGGVSAMPAWATTLKLSAGGTLLWAALPCLYLLLSPSWAHLPACPAACILQENMPEVTGGCPAGHPLLYDWALFMPDCLVPPSLYHCVPTCFIWKSPGGLSFSVVYCMSLFCLLSVEASAELSNSACYCAAEGWRRPFLPCILLEERGYLWAVCHI